MYICIAQMQILYTQAHAKAETCSEHAYYFADFFHNLIELASQGRCFLTTHGYEAISHASERTRPTV